MRKEVTPLGESIRHNEGTLSRVGEHRAKAGMPVSDVKFTVVVCTYNYAHLLPDALRALAAQTLQDFDLLIVDDSSTDGTEEVVRQHSSRFHNCVYLKKPHGGPADTRNSGVREARGTHVALLDADDIWSPHYLEAVRSRLESSPQAELVISNGLRIRSNGVILRPVFPPSLPPLEGPVNSVTSLFALCNDFCPSGMVICKPLYDRIGPFDTRFSHGDDVHWLIRAVMAGAYCVRIDRKLFLYRLHGRNLTNDPIAFLETWLRIYDEQLKNSRLGPECERSATNFARDYVLRLLGICSPSRGRSLLARTLETIPGDFILRCAFLSTYLGSTYALKAMKWGKHRMPRRASQTSQIDLSLSPEIMFQSV
jgi:glycosyltransferase involved in cell wall biosynthesis